MGLCWVWMADVIDTLKVQVFAHGHLTQVKKPMYHHACEAIADKCPASFIVMARM